MYYLSQSEGEDLARRPCRVRDCPRHEGTQALRSLWAKRTEPLRMGTGACRPAGGTQSQKSCSESEPGGHAGPPGARSTRAAQNQNRGAMLARQGHAVPEPLRTRTGSHPGPPGAHSPRAAQNQNRGATPARQEHAVPESLRTRTRGAMPARSHRDVGGHPPVCRRAPCHQHSSGVLVHAPGCRHLPALVA